MGGVGEGLLLDPATFGGDGSGGAVWLLIGLVAIAPAPFYAMLVFAPRQIAEREGSGGAWVVRYGVFIVGTLLGVGWVRGLGL